MNINVNVTFGELLSLLKNCKKHERTWTAKQLHEMFDAPLLSTETCLVYPNGYAVYENADGRTVLWIEHCKTFTYRFVSQSDTTAAVIPDTTVLDEQTLGSMRWDIVITLHGEQRIAANMEHRALSHGAQTSFQDSCGTGIPGFEHPLLQLWREQRSFGQPDAAVILRETIDEKLGLLTAKQRTVFLLYHFYGDTQAQIAASLHISQQAVLQHLHQAEKKLR